MSLKLGKNKGHEASIASIDTEASRESSPDALRGGLKKTDINDDSPPSKLKEIQLADFERSQLHRAKVFARRTQPHVAEEDLVYYAPTALEALGPWIALRSVINYSIETLQRIFPPSKDWLSLSFWFFNITLVIMSIVFAILEVAFWFTDTILPQAWTEWIVQQTNNSIVNQRLFNNMESINENAQEALAQNIESKTYDPRIAEYMLNMSAAVYVRDNFIYLQAESYYQSKFFLDGCKITSFPNLKKADNYTKKKLSSFFRESVAPIVKFTDQMNLSYHLISELETGFGGPYASIMASKTKPFLVVVFKGTSPLSLDEWLIDATYEQVPAQGFFQGFVHQGFYTCLFPDAKNTTPRSESLLDYYPYQTLAEAINLKSSKMADDLKVDKINVWVTGHSLGAGVATLFYGWLLTHRSLLGLHTDLRDAYTYGNPATGNQAYARGYLSSLVNNQTNMLWRLICDSDIVSRVPLNLDTAVTGGIGEPELISVREDSYLNYAAPGNGIRVLSDRAPQTKGAFDVAKETEPPVSGEAAQLGRTLFMLKLVRLIPGAKNLVDHTPLRYAESLRFSRGKYKITRPN